MSERCPRCPGCQLSTAPGVTSQPVLHRPHRAPQQEERAALSQQVSCAPRDATSESHRSPQEARPPPGEALCSLSSLGNIPARRIKANPLPCMVSGWHQAVPPAATPRCPPVPAPGRVPAAWPACQCPAPEEHRELLTYEQISSTEHSLWAKSFNSFWIPWGKQHRLLCYSLHALRRAASAAINTAREGAKRSPRYMGTLVAPRSAQHLPVAPCCSPACDKPGRTQRTSRGTAHPCPLILSPPAWPHQGTSSCPTRGICWAKTLLLEALCSHWDSGCAVPAKNLREVPKGGNSLQRQALLSQPRPQTKTTTAALVLGGTHPAWVAKGLPVPTRDAFIRVPLPMAEAGVKTHEEGWNIDLCATDGCGSAQGQQGQELMPQPQVPHSHVGDTRTGHTLPRLHQAPASTAMLRAQPQHQGPRRQHHQASPVRSPNTSIDKTLALAAQTTNHKSILHDAQPVTAEQVRFSESTKRFLQRLSYLG